eukprot:COSAG01_NODE_90_length_27307_cov_734.166458_14_plen_165_part_00
MRARSSVPRGGPTCQRTAIVCSELYYPLSAHSALAATTVKPCAGSYPVRVWVHSYTATHELRRTARRPRWARGPAHWRHSTLRVRSGCGGGGGGDIVGPDHHDDTDGDCVARRLITTSSPPACETEERSAPFPPRPRAPARRAPAPRSRWPASPSPPASPVRAI